MFYPQELIDEIRIQNDIVSVVSEYVALKQRGSSYFGLCPFHNDRHPSLYISDDHYHCFACGEHGDVIDLTAKLFDLRLYDAARKLASDIHLVLDKP